MGTFVDVPDNGMSRSSGSVQASEIITNQFALVNEYADNSFDITRSYISTLNAMIQGLVVPDVGEIADVEYEPISFDLIDRPGISALSIDTTLPENTAIRPVYTSIPEFEDVTIPALTVSAPEYYNPELPVLNTIASPGDAPTLNQVDIPAMPTYTMPAAPSFDSIVIPEAPSITLPEFQIEVPSVTLSEPAKFEWGEDPSYVSDIWSDLLAKVLDGIRNGGTGLDVEVEDAIYQRLLDKQQDENERLYTEANDYFSSRGWTLPPGALIGRLTEANNQISRNNSASLREITINQAELAQKNTQFIIDKGIQLEEMIRNFYTNNTNRLFEINKFNAQNAIEVYNASVAIFNANMEAFKSQVELYDVRVRAAVTNIEVFKAQIEASKVTADVQKSLVDVYSAQVSAVETQMKLYSAQMEGARIASEIEASKMEAFKLKTQAYIAQLDGEKVKFEVYDTMVRAEATKANTYGERIKAYIAEVDSAKVKVDIQIKKLEYSLQLNTQEIERYKAELEAYKVELTAHLSSNQNVVAAFEAEVSSYNAETSAISSYYQVKIQEITARISEAELRIKKATAEIDAMTRGYESINQLRIQGTTGIMNVGAQLTASALNAVNTSASFGYNGSVNYGESWSHGESISESHNYEEE